MQKGKLQYVYQCVYILLGLVLCTLGYRMFLIPNGIAPGGFTGIAQVVNAVSGINVGTITLILNVPLFLVGFKSMGMKFTALSLISTFALSIMIDYLPTTYTCGDLVLSAVFGGILIGAGFGLILRGDSSTGGTDMLAKIVHEHFRAVKVGVVMFTVDFLVVAASMFVFDVNCAMYAIIAEAISTVVLDYVIDGLNTAKAYFVISRNADEISRRVLEEMERGVTALRGRGQYTGEDIDVLLCVVPRLEAPRLKHIVAECDERAFMIATDVREALGEGFMPNK